MDWILTERFWIWGIVLEVDMRHALLDKFVTFIVLLLCVFSIQREHPYEYWAIRWHGASHEPSEDRCCMEVAVLGLQGIDVAQNGNFATVRPGDQCEEVQSPRFIDVSTCNTNPHNNQINVPLTLLSAVAMTIPL